uniref:Uncharacterized protein n=1 Tax=Canis lupus familiaris TaxID=9615 RepID=A0A8P0T3S0_CANLF
MELPCVPSVGPVSLPEKHTVTSKKNLKAICIFIIVSQKMLKEGFQIQLTADFLTYLFIHVSPQNPTRHNMTAALSLPALHMYKIGLGSFYSSPSA